MDAFLDIQQPVHGKIFWPLPNFSAPFLYSNRDYAHNAPPYNLSHNHDNNDGGYLQIYF